MWHRLNQEQEPAMRAVNAFYIKMGVANCPLAHAVVIINIFVTIIVNFIIIFKKLI